LAGRSTRSCIAENSCGEEDVVADGSRKAGGPRRAIPLRLLSGDLDPEARGRTRNLKISRALMGNQNGRGNRRRAENNGAGLRRRGDDLTRCFLPVWNDQEELEIALGERLAEAFVALVAAAGMDHPLLDLFVTADDAISELLSALWKHHEPNTRGDSM
jgi:hypothetical protein